MQVAATVTSFTASTFVGRQQEMAELNAALNEALSGSGSMVLLSGEPGIGKTRLADELAATARERGAYDLRGVCYEQAGAPPYWPWVETVRDARKKIEPSVLESAVSNAGEHLTRAFPTLGSDVAGRTSEEQGDPAVLRFRSLDAAVNLFKGISEHKPVVLFLEDLHWADEASLHLLSFISTRIQNERILVVGTFLDSEIQADDQLDETLAILSRERNFQLLPVRGLDSADARKLIAESADRNLPEDVVDAIEEQTERNPFFITEIVKGLIDTDYEATDAAPPSDFRLNIPRNARAAIGRRLRRLNARTLRLLTSAAMLGRDFDLPILEALDSQLTGRDLLETVDDALRAGELTEYPDVTTRYRFAHGLIPMTLLQNLDAAEKAEMHAHFAVELEKYYDYPTDEHAAEVAEHFVAAGSLADGAKTGFYANAAGQQALLGRAHTAANRWFDVVLDPSISRDVELELIAQAHYGKGQALAPRASAERKQPAWDHLVTAFNLFLKAGNTERALDAVSHPIAFGRLTGTVDVLQRAVGLARDRSPRLGQLLVAYANAQIVGDGDYESIWDSLTEARQVADLQKDPQLLVQIELSSTMGAYYALDPVKAIRHGQQSERLADDLGAASVVSRLPVFLGNSLAVRGRQAEAKSLVDKGLSFATELNFDHDVVHALRVKAQIEFSLGNWDQAIEPVLELRERVPGALTTELEWLEATVDYEKGHSSIMDALDRLPYHNLAFRALARASMEGDVTAIAQNFRAWTPEWEDAPFVPGWKGRRHASLSITLGDTTSLSKYYELLDPSRIRIDYSTGSTDRLLGQMSLLLGESDRAHGHFADAIEFCRDGGYRPEFVLTCYQFASMLLERGSAGDSNLADELISEGTEIATSIQMNSMVKSLEGLTRIPTNNDPYPSESQIGLSERELQVLLLVPDGKSNQEIGDELFITKNTVANHLSKIRAVLKERQGLESVNRVELAAIAKRLQPELNSTDS